MDLPAHEMKAQTCVERSARQVSLEHLDFELSSQVLSQIDECAPDPGSMEPRIDEYGADLAAEQRNESHDVSVRLPNPRFRNR